MPYKSSRIQFVSIDFSLILKTLSVYDTTVYEVLYITVLTELTIRESFIQELQLCLTEWFHIEITYERCDNYIYRIREYPCELTRNSVRIK